nr:MAG TPA: hypothetical protein [Caudoviricetes sp.]
MILTSSILYHTFSLPSTPFLKKLKKTFIRKRNDFCFFVETGGDL